MAICTFPFIRNKVFTESWKRYKYWHGRGQGTDWNIFRRVQIPFPNSPLLGVDFKDHRLCLNQLQRQTAALPAQWGQPLVVSVNGCCQSAPVSRQFSTSAKLLPYSLHFSTSPCRIATMLIYAAIMPKGDKSYTSFWVGVQALLVVAVKKKAVGWERQKWWLLGFLPAAGGAWTDQDNKNKWTVNQMVLYGR